MQILVQCPKIKKTQTSLRVSLPGNERYSVWSPSLQSTWIARFPLWDHTLIFFCPQVKCTLEVFFPEAFPDVQVTLVDYPVDWSIKSSVKFTSRTSFDWTCSDDLSYARSIHSFLRMPLGDSSQASCAEGEPQWDPAERFQSALHYWKHPASPLPPAFVDALKKQVRLINEFRVHQESELGQGCCLFMQYHVRRGSTHWYAIYIRNRFEKSKRILRRSPCCLQHDLHPKEPQTTFDDESGIIRID